MNLSTLAGELKLTSLTPGLEDTPGPEIAQAFIPGLLSEVLACAPRGALLITGHTHLNAIAVAISAGMPAIIFSMGRTPDPTVRTRAEAQNIRLYTTPLSTFELAGQLHAKGIHG